MKPFGRRKSSINGIVHTDLCCDILWVPYRGYESTKALSKESAEPITCMYCLIRDTHDRNQT